MTGPMFVALLIGLLVGGALMAWWAARRIEEEGARQFHAGFQRGQFIGALGDEQEAKGRVERLRNGAWKLIRPGQPETPPAELILPGEPE
jgi:hypothetical protein